MKNKKLVVLLSVLAIATTPVVVAMAGCDGNKPDNKTEQTTKYTFSFSGGSGATGSVAAIADKATGDKFNLPENGFTKDGYTFAGWSDGTATTPYAAGAEFTVGTSDVTFTAVWTAIDYTVTFAGGDGATGEIAAITGKHVGDKVTLPANGYTKEGYTFVGWLVGTSETPVAAGTEITMTAANVTVTAAWEETTFKVTFVGGDGATGSVDAITGKKEGDVVTLPSTGLTKDGYTLLAWSVDGKIVLPGGKITIGTADVTVNAVWVNYADQLSGDMEEISVNYADGKATVYSKGQKYQNGGMVDVVNALEYTYTVNGSKVTFTSIGDDPEDYVGDIVDGMIVITVPVAHPNYTGDTFVLLSKTPITAIADMGSNGYVQTMSWQDRVYMYSNNFFVSFKGYGTDDPSYGTYESKGNHVYELTYSGDSKVFEMKVQAIDGVGFYSLSDGYKGTYTLGDKTFNFDGYGKWGTNGTYVAFDDGTNSMVVINDPDELVTHLCSISGTTLTAITAAGAGEYTTTAEYPMIAKIYFNGTNLLGLVLSGEEGGESNYSYAAVALVDNKATYEKDYASTIINFADGIFTVVNPYGGDDTYYSLNGAPLPEPDPAIPAGNYVDNLNGGTVTATVTVDKGVSTLTLKSGETETAYTVTEKNGVLTFKSDSVSVSSSVKGYIVDGVVFITGGIKIGSSSKLVALSAEALTSISGVSAGYAVKPGSTSYKLYVFTNNVAVYVTYSTGGKIASYTTSGNGEYALTFADGSAAKTFKVFADDGDTKAYYMESDGLAGTYTDGDTTVVIDGYGTYTIGTDSGKYNAGKSGFTIVKDNAVYKIYKISGTTIAEATETEEKNNSGGNTNTALKEKNIVFTVADVYTGCGAATLHYTVDGGEEQTITIAVGMTFTVGDENFSVTKVADDSVTITRTNDGVQYKSLAFGAAG